MSNFLVTPAQGLAFALLIFGWLACDQMGLTDACVEAYVPQLDQTDPAVSRPGSELR